MALRNDSVLFDSSAKRVHASMCGCECIFELYLHVILSCLSLCKSLGLCKLVHACRSRSMC